MFDLSFTLGSLAHIITCVPVDEFNAATLQSVPLRIEVKELRNVCELLLNLGPILGRLFSSFFCQKTVEFYYFFKG